MLFYDLEAYGLVLDVTHSAGVHLHNHLVVLCVVIVYAAALLREVGLIVCAP